MAALVVGEHPGLDRAAPAALRHRAYVGVSVIRRVCPRIGRTRRAAADRPGAPARRAVTSRAVPLRYATMPARLSSSRALAAISGARSNDKTVRRRSLTICSSFVDIRPTTRQIALLWTD